MMQKPKLKNETAVNFVKP